MKKPELYENFKVLARNVFYGEMTAEKSVDQFIDLLEGGGKRLRDKSRNTLIGINFFYHDLKSFEANKVEPLGIGLVYRKHDNDESQDIYVFHPNGFIDYCRNDKELKERYPTLEGMHKKRLWLVNK